MKKILKEINSETGLTTLIYNNGDQNGPKTAKDKVLFVEYTGYLEDGTIFSSSDQNGQLFQFKLGNGQVIPGWDEGFNDKWPGTEMTLIIPPHLAYGDIGSRNGEIPPEAIITFDVKIKGVEQGK